jgi:hypothetical protein
MKTIAVVQSNFVPWRGYFDLIGSVDEFILFDDVQYTRRDWRNRNLIKSPKGKEWLTVPVEVKGKFEQKICETRIANASWRLDHLKALTYNYKKSPFFCEVMEFLAPIYGQIEVTHLSVLNKSLIVAICNYLAIRTPITESSNFNLINGKSARLVDLCLQAGATHYVSGPAARPYLSEELFRDRGVEVIWFGYDGYHEYPQQWGDFIPNLSIVDLLFNCGKNSNFFMNYLKRIRR